MAQPHFCEDRRVARDVEKKMINNERRAEGIIKELFERKVVASGIQDPWVVVGTFHARVQSEGFSRQLTGCSGTGIWQRAVRLTFNITFILPLGEISQSRQFSGILHPLDDL